jgi:hypothetical protein
MTHNRMFRATTPEENPFVPIGEAVRKALGVSGRIGISNARPAAITTTH